VLDVLYVLQGRTPDVKQEVPALSFAPWLAEVPRNVREDMMHSDGHNYKFLPTPTLHLFLN
jgi:hypothetical protein